ncbi:MAG: hypothetical protein ABEJ61_00775 [Haloferacaceae archaeon]
MPPDRRTDGGRAGTSPSLWSLVRFDLERLHTGWMALAFPRQRDPHPVRGTWTPSTRGGALGYRLWAALGVAVVGLLYPLAVAGFGVRFHGRRLYRAAAALGSRNLLLVTAAVWGALTAAVYLRSYPLRGVVAVAAGGCVATVSAVLALAFARWRGRPTTVLVAAPLGVTALFLPPVVAALYSPALAALVFPTSDLLAVWLLDHPLAVAGVADALRAAFDLAGLAYVAMWFGLAVPVGWALGALATFADAVRAADGPE